MKNQFPRVPAILPPKDKIPHGFRLMVHKWSYPENRLGETVTIKGQQIKKMLTLDINIPQAAFAKQINAYATGSEEARQVFVKNYPCIHRCPGCFNNALLSNPILTFEEIVGIIKEAKTFGLESVKFLGPGELLMNPDLFRILDFFAELDIVVGIFTKGALMGNDALAQHYHSIDSAAFTRRLTSYPNTTFLVGARSFDADMENQFIPQNSPEFGLKFDYHQARNLAIERLCVAGMNTDLSRQRLAIINSPVTAQNIEGAFEMYRWGIERNIPVYVPPTMVSGKGHKLVKSASDQKFEDDYIELAVKIYTWAIERGVMTLEQFKNEGPHPYIGVAPCNQLTHGLYIHYDGAVWRCPGNDTPDFIVHPNVREKSLREIWMGSINYRINLFNNRCVKDGVSLPRRFYTEVRDRIESQ